MVLDSSGSLRNEECWISIASGLASMGRVVAMGGDSAIICCHGLTSIYDKSESWESISSFDSSSASNLERRLSKVSL